MITEKQEMADTFSVLHDGTIESYEQKNNSIILKISCIYLAEHINLAFEYFYVELQEVSSLSLNP
ncbi:hypothetical protein [Bernardetia sp.]|uniref:hypothetical protein n=1 Tax=Bernardetia sp. TaxID=1937974 RepID=UPI0025C53BE8|nr:hypothetical protein [Bernardetia sp.]